MGLPTVTVVIYPVCRERAGVTTVPVWVGPVRLTPPLRLRHTDDDGILRIPIEDQANRQFMRQCQYNSMNTLGSDR
jgi:hypothetical protein